MEPAAGLSIDHRLLQPATLRALAEEFVSREGTDYGAREVSFDAKVDQVIRLLDVGKAKVVFDPETESCDIREVSESR